VPEGMPPSTPVFIADQSTARFEAMIPDHSCACAEVGTIKTNISMIENKNGCARLMFAAVPP